MDKQQPLSRCNHGTSNNLEYKKNTDKVSGMRGQLYETKLLSLTLFRCSTGSDFEEFYLATNIADIGDVDDVCLKYKLKSDSNDSIKQKYRMLLVQTKHTDKNSTVNLADLKNRYSIFSIVKYFNTYKTLRNVYQNDDRNILFQGKFEETNCVLVLFTPSQSHIPGQYKVLNEAPHQITEVLRVKNGTQDVFQITGDLIVQCIISDRIHAIGDLLRSAILENNSNNYHNLMSDLIKRYDVVLAQKVIDIICIKSSEGYCEGMFKPIFFVCKDKDLIQLREFIFQGINVKNREKYNPKAVVTPITFKLPATFGNIYMMTDKVQSTLLVGTFIELFRRATNYTTQKQQGIIEIDNITEIGDKSGYELLRLALISNLLISENNDKKVLKLNSIENIFEVNTKNLFKTLLKKVEDEFGDTKIIDRYKFLINIDNFPFLFFDIDNQEKENVAKFQDILWFCTNQPVEYDINNVLIKEIEVYLQKQNDSSYRLKSNAIFKHLHDKVKKWHINFISPIYVLTKECLHCSNYFEQSRQMVDSIYDYSILKILHFICVRKIKKNHVRFHDSALHTMSLGLKKLLEEDSLNILYIDTLEPFFTMIKLAQWLEQNDEPDVIFLDMELIISEEYYHMLQENIRNTKLKILVFMFRRQNDEESLCNLINLASENSQKIIVVKEEVIKLKHIANNSPQKCLSIYDDRLCTTNIVNMEQLSRFWTVTFQGQEMKFNKVIDDTSKSFIPPKLLWKLINGEKVEIGTPIGNKKYFEVQDFCVGRDLIRDETEIDNIFKDINENVVIVAAEAGMGKSIFLTQLAQAKKIDDEDHTNENTWIVQIKLRYYYNEFRRWRDENINIDEIEVIRFICKILIYGPEIINNEEKYNSNAFKIILHNKRIQLKNFIKNPTVAFELDLFIHYYNEGKIMFLFDGFEEICPCEEEVIKLMAILKRSGPQHQKLWITTKPYIKILTRLESEFSTTAYTLKPLSKDVQALILELYMEVHVNLFTLSKIEISNINDFLDYMYDILSDENRYIKMVNVPLYTVYVAALRYLNRQLVSYGRRFDNTELNDLKMKCENIALILESCLYVFTEQYNTDELTLISENPLHLNIAAEYFITQIQTEMEDTDDFYDKWDLNSKSFVLFRNYLDTKFKKIYLGNKRQIKINLGGNRRWYKLEREKFVDIHKKMALCALFEKSDLLKSKIVSEEELRDIFDIIARINEGEEKTGIVEREINNVPIFNNILFAEYFAVEYICDKLKVILSNIDFVGGNKEPLFEFIMNIILYNSTGGVRTFFDRKLLEDPFLLNAISYDQYKNVVFKILLNQSRSNRANPAGFTFHILRTSLNISVEEDLLNVQDYLLECIKHSMDITNLRDFKEIVGNGLIAFTLLGMNNEALKSKLRACVSPYIEDDDNPNDDEFFSLVMPTFVNDYLPFVSPARLFRYVSILSAGAEVLGPMVNAILTPSIRSVIMVKLRLLWNLVPPFHNRRLVG